MTPVELVVELMNARPRSSEQLRALFAGGWPAFIDADPVAGTCLPQVRELFSGFEIVLVAGSGGQHAAGELVAGCWGVPIRWNGSPTDLPAGYSDSLVRALADRANGAAADTLVICAAQVRPDSAGSGVAAAALRALMEVAAAHGLTRAVAPLRPTGKHRYPLTSIQEYAAWTRPDDSVFDPWLRTHLAMGARVVSTSEASQVFTGTAAQWEAWSGLAMPGSGAYVVPDGLAILHLNRGRDLGELVEPTIWVRHR